MGRHVSPRKGYVILVRGYPVFDNCRLTLTWMCNIRLPAHTLAVGRSRDRHYKTKDGLPFYLKLNSIISSSL